MCIRDRILLRKEYPVLCPAREMLGLDQTRCGVPDVSYHGENAWQAPKEVSSRQLGVYYSGAVAGGDDCFIAYNMHWLEHKFALPALPKGICLRLRTALNCPYIGRTVACGNQF